MGLGVSMRRWGYRRRGRGRTVRACSRRECVIMVQWPSVKLQATKKEGGDDTEEAWSADAVFVWR
jgi:hypothetical protein